MNKVAITNRELCYNFHPEYVNSSEWKAYYDKLLSVSEDNRKECASLLVRLKELTEYKFVVLREKDLSMEEYINLISIASDICKKRGILLIAHTYLDAIDYAGGIHLPLGKLRELGESDRAKIGQKIIGASVHSVEEAIEAQRLGAAYIVAGNIFETDCKKGLAGKGLNFMQDVARAVSIPAYGIGGMTSERVIASIRVGAAGGCMMSQAMKGKS